MDAKKLIEKAKSGDKEAFGQLYSMYYVPVFRYIYIRIPDKKIAEDLTQIVFLKVYKTLERYKNTDVEPLAYFFTVARNTIIDFYRKKKESSLEKEGDWVLEIPDLKNNPEEEFAENENHRVIMEAVEKLPEDQKEVIILKFINDLSNSEIAQIMNKNEPAIRQIQHRALKALREKLGGKI